MLVLSNGFLHLSSIHHILQVVLYKHGSEYVHIHTIMHHSTSKGKEASTTPIAHVSGSLTQDPGNAAKVTVIKHKMQKHQKCCHDPSDLLLFSDPLDDTSSDEQSFDEEDMLGSDSDAETISLAFTSNNQRQSFDEQVV